MIFGTLIQNDSRWLTSKAIKFLTDFAKEPRNIDSLTFSTSCRYLPYSFL